MGYDRDGSLAEALAEAARDVPRLLIDVSRDAADYMAERARFYAPVGDLSERMEAYRLMMEGPKLAKIVWRPPGKLRASIRAGVPRHTTGGVSVEVTAHDEVASFAEYGTRPHAIRPKKSGKLPAASKRRGYDGKFVRNAQALRWVSNGRVMFAPEVWHPGTRATHFMSKAAADTDLHAIDIMDDAFDRWARRAGL